MMKKNRERKKSKTVKVKKKTSFFDQIAKTAWIPAFYQEQLKHTH